MTKLYNKKSNPFADTPIAISEEYTKPDNHSIDYFCSYCHITLSKMSEEEYYCSKCSISQYPEVEEVRSKSRITTPLGLKLEPCLSYAPDPNPTPKHIEPEGAFKALQDKGIRIKNYTEKDGAGKPIKKNRWS